jgi:hypothetical protein
VIIPRRHPSVVLSQELQVRVGAVLPMARPVVPQAKDVPRRVVSTLAPPCPFVDVVAQMDHVVVLVLARGVAVRVEVAIGWTPSQQLLLSGSKRLNLR